MIILFKTIKAAVIYTKRKNVYEYKSFEVLHHV